MGRMSGLELRPPCRRCPRVLLYVLAFVTLPRESILEAPACVVRIDLRQHLSLYARRALQASSWNEKEAYLLWENWGQSVLVQMFLPQKHYLLDDEDRFSPPVMYLR